MSLKHSPSVITDSLAFYYDMHNIKKSWNGAPTTNVFANKLSATTATRAIQSGSSVGVYNGWSATGVANDNPRVTLFSGAITVAASTFYTLSCLYWSSNNTVDDVYLRFTDGGWTEGNTYIQPFTAQSVSRNGSFSITDLGDNWKRCVGTFQTLATTTTIQQVFFDVDTSGVQVFIADMQLEQNTFATPYVNGTRSNTQAILDLTNNNTITATELTYSSNGLFSFDGGSTSASISNNFSYTNGFSFDVMLYPTGAGGNSYGRILDKTTSTGSNQGVFLYVNAAPIVTFSINNTGGISGTVPYNTWTHLCVTASSLGAAMMYVNGVLISTGATGLPSAITNTNLLTIGNRSTATDRGFVGNISNVKIYNREITATEVQQNFQALRSRYGI